MHKGMYVLNTNNIYYYCLQKCNARGRVSCTNNTGNIKGTNASVVMRGPHWFPQIWLMTEFKKRRDFLKLAYKDFYHKQDHLSLPSGIARTNISVRDTLLYIIYI